MEALKNLKWTAEIIRQNKLYFWKLSTESITGLCDHDGKRIKILEGKNCSNKKNAIADLMEFVRVNEITCSMKS